MTGVADELDANIIRLQFLKIGTLFIISVRRVKLAFASACSSRELFNLTEQR